MKDTCELGINENYPNTLLTIKVRYDTLTEVDLLIFLW
jgi:hypothetical protein